MVQYISTAAFCGKLFYIGECLFRESQVPTASAPPLTDEELNECDDIVPDALDRLKKKDLLAMLMRKFNIAIPIDFIYRLAVVNEDLLAVDLAKRDDPTHALQYWFRIANTYSMLFVLDVVQEQCEQEELQLVMEQALGCYEAAVAYAERIDDGDEDRDLVAVLDKNLSDCRELVDKVLLQAKVPDRE